MIKRAAAALIAATAVGLGTGACDDQVSRAAPPSASPAKPASQHATTMGSGLPCTASQLSAAVSFVPAGAGNDEYRIRITDKGRPCSLHGRPSWLYGVDGDGRETVLHPRMLSADYAAGMTTRHPANLTAAKAGEVVLVTTIGCPAAQHSPSADETFTSLRLGIGQEALPVRFVGGPEPGGRAIWLPCGIAMSNFYAAA